MSAPRGPDKVTVAALCLACGIVDAAGFIESGIFAANMTGNTVIAAIAAARLDVATAVQHALTIAAFFAGAMIGRLMLNVSMGRAWVPLSAEALVLAACAVASLSPAVRVTCAAVAMGLQATALPRGGGPAVSTVVLTSTLARMAEVALDRVMGRSPHPARATAGPGGLLATTWASYAAGAAAGALLQDAFILPLLVPAAIVLGVALRHAFSEDGDSRVV